MIRGPARLLALASIAFLAASKAPFNDPGAVQVRSHVLAGERVPYALYLPRSLDRRRPAPLLVALHALRDSPLGILSTPGLTALAERYGFLVVAPEGHNPEGWYGSLGEGRFRDQPAVEGALSERDVLEVLAIARRRFAVDPRRIVLLGHSMGGGGALHLGAKYPELWAGLAVLAPAFQASPGRLAALRDAPVFVVSGRDDAVIPAADIRRLVDELRAAGARVEERVEPGDHYAPMAVLPEAFAFLSRCRRRRPAPEDVAFRPSPAPPKMPGPRRR